MMTPEIKAQIHHATEHLKVQDLILFEARFSRPERDPEKMDVEAEQEHKRSVSFFINNGSAADDSTKSLQVLVELGIRAVASGANENAQPFFIIEADFLVNYEMAKDIDPACIKAFADFNAVHNVWPFWRQHVFDVVSRARLPHLDIPLYSGLMA